MRTELQNGAVLTLTADGFTRTFRIERTIGEGASCIAYEATLVDGGNAGLRYRLKECYPYHAAITRAGNALTWHDENERGHAFQKLKTTHNLLLALRNDEDIGDSIVSSSLCEGNGTLYMVMELNHGVTYDKDDNSSLHDTLDAIRVLAARIGQLHKLGFLNLDIKPSNFLVRHYPSTAVWLFDVDSFTSLQDIASGQAVSYPYSREFAAPEQLCGKSKKICLATDIYAIGAVLFFKMMGRPVCNEDMGPFANWSFDGELFTSVNPKVKRILKELFHKTLAASPSRRYQTVDELLKAINDALYVTVEGKPYLRSTGIGNTIRFVGRQREIKRIHEAFSDGKRAVFLHGEGGMGKSCTAIAYCETYRDHYDAVLFLRYRDSLRETLNQIQIANFESENESERERSLVRLMDHHVLLIIDNFDVEIDQDEYLPELIQDYQAHILITSRTDFSSAYAGVIEQIEIGRLTDEQSLDVFAHAGQLDHTLLVQSNGYQRLCKLIEYNTLLLDLMGKLCSASCISVDDLWQKLRSGLRQTEHMEKVWVQKDGRRARLSIHRALCVLFDMTALNERHQRALRNLYVLRFLNIDRNTYCRFTDSNTIDVLNELVELGWVQKRGQYFLLHPLIEDMIQSDLSPTWENCDALHHIRYMAFDNKYFQTDDEEEAYRHEYNMKFLCSSAMYADLHNHFMREIVLLWLIDLMLDDDTNGLPNPMDTRYKGLYKKLIALTGSGCLSDEEEASILSIHLGAWLSNYRSIFFGKDSEQRYAMLDRESKLAYEQLLVFLKNASQELVDKTVTQLAEYLEKAVGRYAPEDCLIDLYALSPCSFDTCKDLRYVLDQPKSDEERQEWEAMRAAEGNPSLLKDDNPELDQIHQCMHDYRNTDSQKAMIEKIIREEGYSPFFRANLINECIGTLLGRIHLPVTMHDLSAVNWSEQLDILRIERAFLREIDLEELKDDEREDLNSFYEENIVNNIIVLAKLNRLDEFENVVKSYLEAKTANLYQLMRDAKEHRSFLNSDRSFLTLYMDMAVNGLRNLNRACYAVPIVSQFIETWLDVAQKLKMPDDFEEKHCIELYKQLIECMQDASNEENIPERLKLPYDALIEKYKRRIAELTDTRYLIKSPEDE